MDPTNNIWQVALALMAIVGVVLLLGFIAKRIKFGRPTASGNLQIVDTTHLGPKEKLVLVRVADQHILFGMNPQCITKLAQYSARGDFEETLEHVQANQV